MRTQSIIVFAFGLILLTLGNGCTVALWKNDILDSWNEPATESHVRLFQSKPPEKILVVYDEYCGRNETMRPRAYWLDENQKQTEQHRTPHFVSTNSSAGLTVIPVLLSSPDEPKSPQLYAVVATNGQSFCLYSGEAKTASHDLPCYNDGKSQMEKVILTPLAMAGDLTIVGGFVGYIYYLGGLGAGYNPSY